MRSYTITQISNIFERSKKAICTIDPKLEQIEYCNPAFIELFKNEESDLIGVNYVMLLGENSRITPLLFEEICASNSVLKRNFEISLDPSQTEKEKCQISYTGVASAGNESGWLIISIEQTTNMQTQIGALDPSTGVDVALNLAKSNILLSELNSKLKESQSNLESAFEAGNLGHCGINFTTGEVFLSIKARNFFGLSQDGAVTWEALVEVVKIEFREMVNKAFSDALLLGKPVDSTYSITHLISGETRWLRVMAKVHFNAMGKPLKLFGLVMDITEEKNDEQRKNDFITMVSHELKTPLTSAQGFMQLIQRKLEESDNMLMSNLANKAIVQVARMSKLINGFLNVSRLESGKIDIHPEEFNFGELVKEVIEDAIVTIHSHTFQLNQYPDISIQADRDKIQQVLTNLISNAVKYSPAGTTVNVSYERIGLFLKMNVSDQGIGMDADNLSKVFDRFYRVESKPTESISGFGIGLYICKEIVDRHQGRIWAESNLEIGTTFSFTLPLK